MTEITPPLHTNKAAALRLDKHKRASKKSKELIEKGDVQGVIDSLSHLQRRFCEEYLVDFNATQAVVRAGYRTKWPSRVGSQLLRTPPIRVAIDGLREQRGQSSNVSKDDVLKGIYKAIRLAEDKENVTGMLRGYELLAKHLGMFVERTEISGPDGEAIQMEQKTKESAEEFTNKLISLAKKKNVKPVE